MSASRKADFLHEVVKGGLVTFSLRVMFVTGLILIGQVTGNAQTNAAANGDKTADLLRDHRSDIVLIKGKAGSGSGFIVNLKGRKYLVSNAHVMAAVRTPTFTPVDRTQLRLKPASASVAVGHDVILLEVLQGGNGIPLVDSFETEVAVNDPIAVYGNTGGGDVVTAIKGKLLGIGPNRIEISGETERGNSGSPIIHVPSGKVIGVATYATADDLISGETKIRRFGYRLDTVKQWQQVDWGRFYAEADQLEKIQNTTVELQKAFLELNGLNQRSNKVRMYAYDSPIIRDALDKFYKTLDEAETQRDAAHVVNTLLGTLRGVSSPPTVKPSFTYDYFRRQFAEQDSDRTEIMRLVVKILQK